LRRNIDKNSIEIDLSQNELKLAYTNVEFKKKLTSRTSASRGRRAWKGQGKWQREEEEGGR